MKLPSVANRCSSFFTARNFLPCSVQIMYKMSLYNAIPSSVLVASEKYKMIPSTQKKFFSSLPEIGVIHNPDDNIFTLSYENHDTAYLKYRYMESGKVDMFTTVVPNTLGGKGVAKILADAAFNWAVKNNVKMKLSCWYLSGYLKRHPREDVQSLLA